MSAPRGFTLLEVMVALLVLGLIVAGLAALSQLAAASIAQQSRTLAADEDVQPVDAVLRRLVAGIALPLDPAQPGLAGDQGGFAAIAADAVPAAGTARVDIALGVDDAHRLVLRWTPHVHAVPIAPRPAPRSTVLLTRLDRMEVSYLSPDRTSWLAGWNRADLPALIRIRLLFPAGDARHWPPIVAATALARATPLSG